MATGIHVFKPAYSTGFRPGARLDIAAPGEFGLRHPYFEDAEFFFLSKVIADPSVKLGHVRKPARVLVTRPGYLLDNHRSDGIAAQGRDHCLVNMWQVGVQITVAIQKIEPRLRRDAPVQAVQKGGIPEHKEVAWVMSNPLVQ